MASPPPLAHGGGDARGHRRDHHYRKDRSIRRARGDPPSTAAKAGGRLGGCACCGGGTRLPPCAGGPTAAGAAAATGCGGGNGGGGGGGGRGGGSALLAPARVATVAAAALFAATAVVVVMVAGPARPLLTARLAPLAAGGARWGWTVTGESVADSGAATPAAACGAAAAALLTPDHGQRFWGEGGSTGLKRVLGTARARLAATDGQGLAGGAEHAPQAGAGGATTTTANSTTTTATIAAAATATPAAAAAPAATTATAVAHREHPVVVDVGANEGQSLNAWRRAYAAPRIYAVEGNPDTAERLAATLAREGVADADAFGGGAAGEERRAGGVTLLQSLVGNTTREATFRRSRAAAESQVSGLWPDGAAQRDHHKFDYVVRWGTVAAGGWR